MSKWPTEDNVRRVVLWENHENKANITIPAFLDDGRVPGICMTVWPVVEGTCYREATEKCRLFCCPTTKERHVDCVRVALVEQPPGTHSQLVSSTCVSLLYRHSNWHISQASPHTNSGFQSLYYNIHWPAFYIQWYLPNFVVLSCHWLHSDSLFQV